LCYDEPFQRNRRDIALSGAAFFEVAKDKTKPFTVTAGGLSTTAVGTAFRVCENKARDRVSVRLVTGKVVIRKVVSSGIRDIHPIYLNPGEELILERQTGNCKVHAFSSEGTGIAGSNERLKKPAAKDLVFNNTPLNEVFEQLGKRYGIPVSHQGDGFEKLTFTGRYGNSDTEDNILSTIVLLNHLGMQKDSSGFIITK
jgi:ferric-dicitrate binding protein FerR (iron transport regulator)